MKSWLKQENADDPENYVIQMWREFRYRQIMHMTHEQFLDEPRDHISWFLAFHGLMNE